MKPASKNEARELDKANSNVAHSSDRVEIKWFIPKKVVFVDNLNFGVI